MKKPCPTCGQAIPEPCGLVVDTDRDEVRFAGISIEVSGKEMRIMEALATARGRVVRKGALFNALYFDQPGGEDIDDKIIDVFICKLRAKLAPLEPHGVTIKTYWGKGWELILPGLVSREAEIPITAGDIAGLQYGGPRS